MRSNEPVFNNEKTFEGGPAAVKIPPVKQLIRQVATCMLFENTFYEKGSQIAEEIAETCKQVPVMDIATTAILAREDFKLRHVPLFLLAQLDLRRSEMKGLVAATTERVVQRPDEMAELLSIIEKVNPGKPIKKILSAQIKKGLAKAFQKFNEYQLAKWNRDNKIKLRDVMFLVHPKPKTFKDENSVVVGDAFVERKYGNAVKRVQRHLTGQGATWKKLVDGTLETPDTWEVALSAGKDRKETFERLIQEKKLGYMALLMNLRNMEQAGVNFSLVENALREGAPHSKALPFRFVSAFLAAPSYAQALSDAMLEAITKEPLHGSTFMLIDVSASMDDTLSQKGTLNRWQAAAALAILLREVCQSIRVFTFSSIVVEVANLRGLGLLESIKLSQPHHSTLLGSAVDKLMRLNSTPDRLICITDEQSEDGIGRLKPSVRGYLVNVAPYKPGLETSGGWTRINGFSERILDWIRFEESSLAE